MRDTHAKYMTSPNDGFDRFCDFHIGHQLQGQSLDKYIAALKAIPGSRWAATFLLIAVIGYTL